MTQIPGSPYTSSAYDGCVSHTRLRPATHSFTYKVFALLLDVDEIDQLHKSLGFFSRNRFNLLGFYDRDHGARNGLSVAAHIRELLGEAGFGLAGMRIELLCYPRILGFVFNPLSVYFCHDAHDLTVIIYEVSNTVGERKSYIIPVEAGGGDVVLQTCNKEMYVSPFTSPNGRYDFRIRPPSERVVVGVDFSDADGLTLKTSFSARKLALTRRTIARLLARHPLMIVKIIGGIHLEAFRLWLKGVPIVARHTSPRFSYSVAPSVNRDTRHANE